MAAVDANNIGLEVCDVDAEDWTTGCVADYLWNAVLPRRPAARGLRQCGVQLTQRRLVVHRQDYFTSLTQNDNDNCNDKRLNSEWVSRV